MAHLWDALRISNSVMRVEADEAADELPYRRAMTHECSSGSSE